MRRVVLLLAAMAVALLVSSGVALAVIKTCPTNCFGTQGPDTLDGSTNANVIKALGGAIAYTVGGATTPSTATQTTTPSTATTETTASTGATATTTWRAATARTT